MSAGTRRSPSDPIGFPPDAKFDMESYRNTLAVRAEIDPGQAGIHAIGCAEVRRPLLLTARRDRAAPRALVLQVHGQTTEWNIGSHVIDVVTQGFRTTLEQGPCRAYMRGRFILKDERLAGNH